MQAKLVQEAAVFAAEAELRVYSVIADGNAVNFSMFSERGATLQHPLNVELEAQTVSSLVSDAIEVNETHFKLCGNY